jgi:hypothetical protein
MAFPKAPFQSAISDGASKVFGIWQQWLDRVQLILNAVTNSGPTAGRPTSDLYVGQPYFDTDLGQQVIWNGTAWTFCGSGFYGTFFDNTNQTAANTTTAYAVTFNTPDGANGVLLKNSSQITFPYTGVYNIQFSIQFINTDNNSNNPLEVNVWFRQNGSDIAESNSQFTIVNKHGAYNGATIAALNFIASVNANDYIQLMWQTENTNISIKTLPAGTTPTTPVTPSVILTATQV